MLVSKKRILKRISGMAPADKNWTIVCKELRSEHFADFDVSNVHINVDINVFDPVGREVTPKTLYRTVALVGGLITGFGISQLLSCLF
jgi:hypothetical protein